jgi:hypothetical protein
VVETRPREGLADVTGPLTVNVVAERDTLVTWTNRGVRDSIPEIGPVPGPVDSVGVITVQKRIESPAGVEARDARLDSFVFEVRDADADTVVTVLFTDSAGTASDTVPAGEYTLVEIFGPRDVAVRAGQDTLVTWTNTYPRPTDFGTIAVHTKVEWPLGFEARSAPLEGFVFEVRHVDSQTVLRTLITDTMGIASAHVPHGTYDIVEIDAQELNDRTGQARVRVTGREITRLGWINRRPWPLPLLMILLGGLVLLPAGWLLRRRPRVTTVSRVRSASVKSEKRL